jgi:hypothetical protein
MKKHQSYFVHCNYYYYYYYMLKTTTTTRAHLSELLFPPPPPLLIPPDPPQAQAKDDKTIAAIFIFYFYYVVTSQIESSAALQLPSAIIYASEALRVNVIFFSNFCLFFPLMIFFCLSVSVLILLEEDNYFPSAMTINYWPMTYNFGDKFTILHTGNEVAFIFCVWMISSSCPP